MKKVSFFKISYLGPITLLFSLVFLVGTAYFINMGFEKNDINYIYIVIPCAAFSTAVVLAGIYLCRRIEIWPDKVVEKSMFGKIKKECIISDIIEVRLNVVRGGPYIMLKDNRINKKYITFNTSEKRLKIVRSFWAGEIKSYNTWQ